MTDKKIEESNEVPHASENVDAAQSAFLQCTLPTGLLDDDGELHTETILREMTGEEEDILTARKGTMSHKLQMILEKCVVRVGSIDQSNAHWSRFIKTLTMTDRLFLIIRIRHSE